jgi:hypothetical protein
MTVNWSMHVAHTVGCLAISTARSLATEVFDVALQVHDVVAGIHVHLVGLDGVVSGELGLRPPW